MPRIACTHLGSLQRVSAAFCKASGVSHGAIADGASPPAPFMSSANCFSRAAYFSGVLCVSYE